jgi:hypothetical protein
VRYPSPPFIKKAAGIKRLCACGNWRVTLWKRGNRRGNNITIFSIYISIYGLHAISFNGRQLHHIPLKRQALPLGFFLPATACLRGLHQK